MFTPRTRQRTLERGLRLVRLVARDDHPNNLPTHGFSAKWSAAIAVGHHAIDQKTRLRWVDG
jgi:hypothetical protein